MPNEANASVQNVNTSTPDALGSLSEALQRAVDRAAASVARVEGRRGYALSGIVLDADHVVTTSRAVAAEGDIKVVSAQDDTPRKADVVGADAHLDIALLHAPGHGMPAATLEPAGEARVGELVLRVARSSGDTEATFGIVRRVGGPWRTPWGARFPISLHCDADPFRGFSGGPLVRASGAVLGMSTAALSRRRNDVIPTETIERVVAELREHGRVRRGYLGISVQPVSLPDQMAERIGMRRAALIAGMADDAPAYEALLVGDILVSLGGEPIDGPGALVGLLDQHAPGAKVAVRVVRGGELTDLEVTVGARR